MIIKVSFLKEDGTNVYEIIAPCESFYDNFGTSPIINSKEIIKGFKFELISELLPIVENLDI